MISVSSSGNYILTPRSGESSGKALSLASSSDDRGIKLQQNTYTDNDDFSDEWWITDEVLDIDCLYDKGFEDRCNKEDISPRVRIENAAIRMTEIYFERFKIPVRCRSIKLEKSFADKCWAGINTLCENFLFCPNSLTKNHHKNVDLILDSISTPSRSGGINVMFTGHVTCGDVETKNGKEHRPSPVAGVSEYSSNRVLICDFQEGIQIPVGVIFIHEMGHLFAVEDHYGRDGVRGSSSTLHESKDCIYGEDSNEDYVIEQVRICKRCTEILQEGLPACLTSLN